LAIRPCRLPHMRPKLATKKTPPVRVGGVKGIFPALVLMVTLAIWPGQGRERVRCVAREE